MHTDGRLSSTDDIDQVVVATRNGVPIHVSEVATVGLGQELRTGAATTRGSETVIGTAIMLFGENSRLVAKRVGDTVLAGTINLWGVVEATVLRPAAESSLQKIIHLIKEAQQLHDKAETMRKAKAAGVGD